ncbi:arabinan endo-1,5-alpha-L-arabinosidase [Fibrivirga algicola]|uniref:Family 43 glycosylhydrolase n=1 Tax=Fibrivirga algicola TaxID=2950420 RepID=A0ABX0Q9D8_9BACT|nr:arabinan endo-1,5-alpha-L-arabinosidase [Fibrivirga algicola]NID08741.1 family 43 glycosylhydrolase [Fibrivirga algicola]
MPIYKLLGTFALWLLMVSCKQDTGTASSVPVVPVGSPPPAFDLNSITDNYANVAPFSNYQRWGSYNVHDPSILKIGDYYYCYNTDVAYGTSVRPGIQIRKSKDLIEWTFVGWVFNAGLPIPAANFIRLNNGKPNEGIWAPYIMQVGSELRLYYSLSSDQCKLSAIGLATATNPEGPWVDKGIVVSSTCQSNPQTNAIDPTVIVTASGEHWMHYGSGYDGIYTLPLNPATGMALTTGDKGRRIANRGFTSGRYNGNIEGPEIIYHPTLKKYFLFIAYDWIDTKYNVRVGRSDSPTGPFYDFDGKDLNLDIDHGPMILAPYQFSGHSGWQGVSHCSVFAKDGQFFMAHQGRPGFDKYFMHLHVRKLFWTPDGWPVVSPERYAGEDEALVAQTDLSGDWEAISLGYRIVPGYDREQTSPDFQQSVVLKLNANGTVNADAASKWTYAAPWLSITWSDGLTDQVLVQKGRDWENKKATVIFTGLNNKGTAVWGKKK